MTVRKLRFQPTAVLTVGGLGAIVAGLWVGAAEIFNATIGAAVGLIALGVAALLIASVST